MSTGDPGGTRILVLGPVAITTGGGAAAVPGQQGHVLSLLAAAHPNPVATEVLIDELWPDRPPPSRLAPGCGW